MAEGTGVVIAIMSALSARAVLNMAFASFIFCSYIRYKHIRYATSTYSVKKI